MRHLSASSGSQNLTRIKTQRSFSPTENLQDRLSASAAVCQRPPAWCDLASTWWPHEEANEGRYPAAAIHIVQPLVRSRTVTPYPREAPGKPLLFSAAGGCCSSCMTPCLACMTPCLAVSRLSGHHSKQSLLYSRTRCRSGDSPVGRVSMEKCQTEGIEMDLWMLPRFAIRT